MKNTKIISIALVCFLPMLLVFPVAEASDMAQEQKAKHILDTTDVKGGLIVHVGCGDGRLTAALCANESYLVHGLDVDAVKVKQARKHIKSHPPEAGKLGLEGSVSVDTFDGKKLPYIDNLVNLVVAEDLDDVPMAEVMRVLAPKGVAYVQRDGMWIKTVKPWPDEIDEWTHFLHGPDGNAVAQDEMI